MAIQDLLNNSERVHFEVFLVLGIHPAFWFYEADIQPSLSD